MSHMGTYKYQTVVLKTISRKYNIDLESIQEALKDLLVQKNYLNYKNKLKELFGDYSVFAEQELSNLVEKLIITVNSIGILKNIRYNNNILHLDIEVENEIS